jgi:CubicO group peptidase (beta-lactamase class C family)
VAANQASVQALLDGLVERGPEVGLQVAAYLDGSLVVDAWAGLADEASRRSVDGETLFNVSSTGKGVAATCLHLLVDRGAVDYAAPVAAYWPEFAAHGKSGVTVEHVLSHRSGIPQTPEGYGPEMLIDWDRMCAGIAQLEPMFEPGTRTAYQAVTFGFMVGEIIRRVDGRPIGQFVQEEIARPLHAESLYFGVPDAALPRVATITEGSSGAERRPGTPAPVVNSATFNREDVRKAAIPSSGGIMNARSLARHYACLAAGGELDGVFLLSSERIRVATALQTDAEDELYKVRVKRGLGYRLGNDTGAGAGPSAFGHVGGGYGYADPERHFAIAFLKNYTGRTPAGQPAAGEAVYSAVAAALALPG